MTVFVDTSVFMRRLLKQPGAFTDWSAWDLAVSSELLRVEAHRVLDRLRLQRAFRDADLAELHRLLQASFRALEFMPLNRAVLNRAADPFPPYSERWTRFTSHPPFCGWRRGTKP